MRVAANIAKCNGRSLPHNLPEVRQHLIRKLLLLTVLNKMII